MSRLLQDNVPSASGAVVAWHLFLVEHCSGFTAREACGGATVYTSPLTADPTVLQMVMQYHQPGSGVGFRFLRHYILRSGSASRPGHIRAGVRPTSVLHMFPSPN